MTLLRKIMTLAVVALVMISLTGPTAVEAATKKLTRNYVAPGKVHVIRDGANVLFFAPKGWKKDVSTKNLLVEYEMLVRDGTALTFITVDVATGFTKYWEPVKSWNDFIQKELPEIEADTEYKKVINKSFPVDGVTGVRVDYPESPARSINVYFPKDGCVYHLKVQVDSDEWKKASVREAIEQSIATVSVRMLGVSAHTP
jgi:hypothetical protein